MSKRGLVLLWGVTGIYLLWLSRPFFSPGYFQSHDIDSHVTRSQAFLSAWREGQFPVRWIGWAFHDAGAPLFTYYSSGFYMIVSGLTFIGLPFHWSFQVSIWLLWISGGIGMALFMRRFGHLSAWLSALLWWFSPYVITDIFLRSALPELTAFSLSLWGWWIWDRWLMKPTATLGLVAALLFAAIGISHLPTALLMFPVYILYTMMVSQKQKGGLSYWLSMITVGIMSLGLAAYYVIPAVAELPFIRSQELKEGYYHYQWHFLQPWQLWQGSWYYGSSHPGTTDDMPFGQAAGQWIIFGLACLWIAGPVARFAGFWIIVTSLAYLFTLEWFKPVWDTLPFLGYIQYPWRNFLLSTLGTAALGGWLVSQVPYRWQQGGVIIIVIAGVVLITSPRFKPFNRHPFEKFPLENFSSHQEPYAAVGVEEAYLPVGSNSQTAKGLALFTIQEGRATIAEGRVTSASITATINALTDSSFLVRRWWFPGWSLRADSVATPLHRDETGLIRFSLPAGPHVLSISYTGTILERGMNWVSMTTLAVWIMSLIYVTLKQRIDDAT